MANEEEPAHAPTETVPAGGAAAIPTGTDGVAAALALEQSNHDPELAADLRSYLHDQRNLAGVQQRYLAAQVEHLQVQMEYLHEQRHLTLTHMRYQHFNDWLSSAWKVLLVILGTGVVLLAGWLAWDARQDKGLVMEAFHVPEDLAAKGYTGTVVAERVLDHLKALQADSTGTRANSTYSLNWGENLKVEIPETGVSLGELKNFLHENFGRQTRIGGEIVHTDQGIAIQVRAGEESGVRIDGTVSALDALTERAAERIYSQTQPYRYASVIIARGRPDEGLAVLRALAANSKFPATERAWAYQGLSLQLSEAGDIEGARQAGLEAVDLDPNLFDSHVAVGAAELSAGHYETMLKYFNQASVLMATQPSRVDVDPLYMNAIKFELLCGLSMFSGDFELAPNSCETRAAVSAATAVPVVASAMITVTVMRSLLVHDMAGARATLEAAAQIAPGIANVTYAQGVEDWSTAARSLSAALQAPAARRNKLQFTAELAYATARLGDLDAAEKFINETPADCYPCVRTRGKIAALKKDWPTAERWFSEAAKQGPSLPMANSEWGEMLLTKGDTDRAIMQFQEAVKRQPHFADPYQHWGEALLAKGDARGAIKKFEQAVKYAPKWGRIQIQWGAALKKLGRNDEARQKFAAAEAVELVPSERALLTAAM